MNINIILDAEYICKELSEEKSALRVCNLFMMLKHKSNIIIIQDKDKKMITNILHQLAYNFENMENQEGTENLKVLENIDVMLTVEVGRTEITIKDLLRLNEGSVVELDRLAGDPLDIMVNNTKIAKGEVVMVGERFGVRFGEIVDPEKRMESI